MTLRTPRIWLAGALLLASGCMKNYVRPAAGKTVELGGLKAEYHAFGSNLCNTDPRVVNNELEAMNAVLLKFVDGTSAGFDGVWADEHVKLLEQGKAQLPAALDAYEPTVRDLARCKFGNKSGLEDSARKGEELVRQSRARLDESAELLPYAQAKVALAKWKAALPQTEETARQNWCPAKVRRGSADIYLVYADEEGVTQYLFCDGSKVTRPEGGKLAYVAPDAKKTPTKPYFDAAAGYPSTEIQKAPRLPERGGAKGGDGGEAQTDAGE